VKGRGFFPLDRKLKLRSDHCSDGAAKVATLMALRATSFERAAADYQMAVGGTLPHTSAWRVTTGAGAILAQRKKVEAERAVAVPERGESPQHRRVVEDEPITGRANVSTDGTMILIRTEGWKEIKMSAISAVHLSVATATPAAPRRRSELPRGTTGARAIRAGGKAVDVERSVAVPVQIESIKSRAQRRVADDQPIAGRATIASDGAMIVIGGEGREQIKTSAICALSRREVSATRTDPMLCRSDAQRAHESRVRLSQHSYVAGLWEVDEFLPYQYAEGLRRGLDRVETLSSVNDAAAWIDRVTATNFPHAVQIVDWNHASGHLHTVATEVLGEGSPAAATWVEARKDELWDGQVETVVDALYHLGVEDRHWPAAVSQAPGYFETNHERMHYPEFRDAGYPIGSGTVESAANNVVKLRMCRPGRGWARPHTNGMLALLCEYHSGRFDRTWASLSQPAA
jgi:hypothetical protein